MTSNALVIRQGTDLEALPVDLRPPALSSRPAFGLPNTEQFEMMGRIAQTVLTAGAGMVPDSFKTPEAAMAVMIAGFEKGFTPFAALRQVFVINGRTEFMTPGLIAIVREGDPTAEFIFHRIERDGADVELVRRGRTVARFEYTEADRAAAHQGERKKVKEWRQRQGGGKSYPVYHEPPQYELDYDSYWNRWPRDAYLYNAVKRCVKVGAPDLLYMAPPIIDARPMRVYMEPTAEERLAEPQGDLHKALIEGAVSPAEVFNDGPPDDPDPPTRGGTPTNSGSAPAAVRKERTTAANETRKEDPPAPSDGPADPRTLAEIERLMLDCKASWPSGDYLTFYKELVSRFGTGGKFAVAMLATRSKAAEALGFIRAKRGESDMPPWENADEILEPVDADDEPNGIDDEPPIGDMASPEGIDSIGEEQEAE